MVKQYNLETADNIESGTASNGVQSVSRALALLEAFPVYGPEIGLTAIADTLGLNKATAYRLLSTLEARGFVERSPDSRKYRLGVRTFELGTYFQSQLDVRKLALPYMTSMAEQTNEAAFLCVREGDEALCLERVESEQEVNIFTLRVGGRQPLHCGGAPRALLSGFDVQELEAYAKRTGLPGFTPRSITTLEQLLGDVRQIRQQGYAFSIGDVVMGIAAIGSPVRDHLGRVVAAISLSGLVARFTNEHIETLIDVVVENADQISIQMGFRN